MEKQEVKIKNYQEYIEGMEVEATVEVKNNKIIRPGERVMVFKDSMAASSPIPVPREKQHQAIGVEGVVTGTEIRESDKSGSLIQILKLMKG
jgi:hypothetical protein